MKTVILRIAGIAAALVVLSVAGAFLWLQTSLPVYSGARQLPGLKAEVEIVYDAHAVPHIRAASAGDAYRALGFVHARDRLFQMDFMRRLGAGRLSEVIGKPTVEIDRTMRTLGLYRLAGETLRRLPPDATAMLAAYAAGVNAFLSGRAGALPPEFVLLNYEPEQWKPADSLVWGRLMAMRLTGNWRTEALRAALADRLTPSRIGDLWPNPPADVPPTLASADAARALLRGMPSWFRQVSASNSWVLSGSRTQSGKPLLANDPHLGFRAPGLWYLARIETPAFELTGATAPGVPFHILGHNGRIAWAFTTTDSDTQDLFLERRIDGDAASYLAPDGPRAYAVRTETLTVRGEAPEKIRIRSSRNGPLISDVYGRLRAATPRQYDVALSAAGLRPDDLTPLALMRLNRARTPGQIRLALRDFHAPQQNISYADTDGNIGLVAPGRVPVRRSGKGKVPSPGWTGERDWTGFIPYDSLPRIENPASGAIVNANHRLVPPDYEWYLTDDWSAPYRARRLHALLAPGDKHSPASFARMQNDNLSLAAVDLAPILLSRLDRSAAPEIAALLSAWDGSMLRARPEPLIFMQWLAELGRSLYADELGDMFPRYRGLRPRTIRHMLTRRPDWCDDVGTPARETCAQTVTASFRRAVSALRERYGDDHMDWQWGKAHRATFAHPLFGRIPVLRELADIRVESDGGAFTVNRAQPRLSGPEPFASVHGPGYRAIYDLSNLSESLYATATGQSGNFLSPYYADNTEAWRDGKYIKIPQSRTEALKGSLGILKLLPVE